MCEPAFKGCEERIEEVDGALICASEDVLEVFQLFSAARTFGRNPLLATDHDHSCRCLPAYPL